MHSFTRTFAISRRRSTLLATITGLVMMSGTMSFADVKRIPVSTGSVSGLLQSCLLQGGGDHRNDHQLPVFCCATNSEGTRWCVACYSGTEQNPSDCSVTTKARVGIRERLSGKAPGSDAVVQPPEAPAPTTRSGLFGLRLSQPPAIVAPNN